MLEDATLTRSFLKKIWLSTRTSAPPKPYLVRRQKQRQFLPSNALALTNYSLKLVPGLGWNCCRGSGTHQKNKLYQGVLVGRWLSYPVLKESTTSCNKSTPCFTLIYSCRGYKGYTVPHKSWPSKWVHCGYFTQKFQVLKIWQGFQKSPYVRLKIGGWENYRWGYRTILGTFQPKVGRFSVRNCCWNLRSRSFPPNGCKWLSGYQLDGSIGYKTWVFNHHHFHPSIQTKIVV